MTPVRGWFNSRKGHESQGENYCIKEKPIKGYVLNIHTSNTDSPDLIKEILPDLNTTD